MLHNPTALRAAARKRGVAAELEYPFRQVVAENFVRRGLRRRGLFMEPG